MNAVILEESDWKGYLEQVADVSDLVARIANGIGAIFDAGCRQDGVEREIRCLQLARDDVVAADHGPAVSKQRRQGGQTSTT